MLVLTRRTGEEILINQGEISIHILRVRGGNVSVGIHAPPYINILRKEVFLRQQNDEGVKSKDSIIF